MAYNFFPSGLRMGWAAAILVLPSKDSSLGLGFRPGLNPIKVAFGDSGVSQRNLRKRLASLAQVC
jgi:hypothetical protein